MKFRPIALLCALAMVVWGGFAVASVVAQIEINNKFGWPGTDCVNGVCKPRGAFDTWGSWATWLGLAASAVGVLALIFGLVGFVKRVGLHLGAIVVIVSMGLTAGGLTISHTEFEQHWIHGTNADPSGEGIYDLYVDGISWHRLTLDGVYRWWFFVTDMLIPLAGLVLLLWLLVLVTGAGKRRKGGTPAAAVTGPHTQVVASGIPQEDFRYAAPADLKDLPAAEAERAPEAEVEPEAAPEPALAPEPEPDSAPAEHDPVWFVTVQGGEHGPYTRAQLRSYLDEGRLHSGTITHLAGEADRALADVLA